MAGATNNTDMVMLNNKLTATNNHCNPRTGTMVMVSSTMQDSMDAPWGRMRHSMGNLLRLIREDSPMDSSSRRHPPRQLQNGKLQRHQMAKFTTTTKELALRNGILRQICNFRHDCCLWDVVRSFDNLHVFLSFLFFVIEVTV